MRSPGDRSVHLDRFPKGIDNAHIDVLLSERFVHKATQLVRRLLEHEVSVNVWGESPPEPATEDIEGFVATYVSLTEVAVEHARSRGSPETIQLFQLAATKFLLQLVGIEMDRLRSRLQRARDHESGDTRVSGLEIHDRLVALARDQQAIRYRLNRELFRHVHKLESTRLRKLRKSVLGQSWPLSRHLLINPLLLLPAITADEQLIAHYNLMLTDRDARSGFSQVNRLVTGLLRGWLPDWALAPQPDAAGSSPSLLGPSTTQVTFRQRLDQGGLSGFLEAELLLTRSLSEDEYAHDMTSWLDVPENLDRVFARPQTPGRQGAQPPLPKEGWEAQGRRLGKALYWRFWRAGLLRRLMASYEVKRVHGELQGKLPARMIYQYLAGTMSRRRLRRRLSGSQIPLRPHDVLPLLDRTRSRVRRLTRSERHDRLMRFVKDFAAFRRDLKCAYAAYRAMDRIRLLYRPEHVELSRANGSLQQFVERDELEPHRERIRNHVIVKADVRGSTQITEQLLRRKLNPATHFSLNFFGPITKLLEDFGAAKVFVEGDAVILSLFEYEDVPFQWLSVSHACGLARKILAVVDAQNAKNRKHSLPELELGLGIAFAEGAPTFLYDEERQIMISSAINRADQLSSCAGSLRAHPFCTARGGRGVEVVLPGGEVVEKLGPEKTLRYNVNGVELEHAAFRKLKSELALRKIELVPPGETEPTLFHVARYPDLKGAMHWLVIRDAPVRVWSDGRLAGANGAAMRFYEVITDAAVVAAVRERAGARRAPASAGSPAQGAARPRTRPGVLH